ncbi:MAG: hypothetical protein PHE48_03210 [Candidatus Daviesbacteria bacterium]|nr:hypothetical protein [Candidatus Daviesbacteria bacterium]
MVRTERRLVEDSVSQEVDSAWQEMLSSGEYSSYIKMNLEPYQKDLELGIKPEGMSDPIFNYLQAVRRLIRSWDSHLG